MTVLPPNSYRAGPDDRGHFGVYGGRFVAETLMPLVLDLECAYEEAKNDPGFHTELNALLKHYVGRPSALLLLGDRDIEVEVEVAAEGGGPGKRPPHPPLVRLQLHERRQRHRRKRDVVVAEVDGEAVEPVGNRRAGCTPRRVVGPEHEVVEEELRAPSEELCQRGAPLVGLESILLVDANPRQVLPPPCQLVAAPRELLFRLEQLEPSCEPILTCPGHMCRHRPSLLAGGRGID